MRLFLLLILALATFVASAQKNIIYENLPLGKYAVGFKIITIIDDSRVDKPLYDYLGEKNKGDRRRRITIHLWYPAESNSGKRKLVYADYCYNNSFSTTDETISTGEKETQLAARRSTTERWFGSTTDDDWKKLIQSEMLAKMDAEPLAEKFPLLVGTLRDLSTSVTNEFLASNGYVIAMIHSLNASSFAEAALNDIPDMRFAISHLLKTALIGDDIGTFGFSGSGFSQVLFAMNDYRIKALADIESGIYVEGLFQALSASNYYDPAKLRVPFLHIFSHDLSLQEKYIDEFEKKTKFVKRYRLILNQPKLHHWDFAAEGFTSCIFLNNRGTAGNNIRHSFEIASVYLLNFFNAELKGDPSSQHFLSAKPELQLFPSSLWDITLYEAVARAPNTSEFEYIVRKRGINEALQIVRATIEEDTTGDIRKWFLVNMLGYKFLNEQKYADAIGVFTLNTELHPEDANLFDSLAEAFERSGDKENMKKNAEVVINMLNKKTSLTDTEKGLKTNAEKRLKF
jgi:hypothetical protein